MRSGVGGRGSRRENFWGSKCRECVASCPDPHLFPPLPGASPAAFHLFPPSTHPSSLVTNPSSNPLRPIKHPGFVIHAAALCPSVSVWRTCSQTRAHSAEGILAGGSNCLLTALFTCWCGCCGLISGQESRWVSLHCSPDCITSLILLLPLFYCSAYAPPPSPCILQSHKENQNISCPLRIQPRRKFKKSADCRTWLEMESIKCLWELKGLMGGRVCMCARPHRQF